MIDIEPYDGWERWYRAADDPRSPFYQKNYSEYECTETIYNYYIHPRWDSFGSSTLYAKILYVSYSHHFAVIELMGEWNDCLYNDSMYLKRHLIDTLLYEGICYFILIGENVLNFHYYDASYYEEWHEEIGGEGWIVLLNPSLPVLDEWQRNNLNQYIYAGDIYYYPAWRTLSPLQLFEHVAGIVPKRIEHRSQPRFF